MRYTILTTRSAGTAIAAVLALAPFSAGAQAVSDTATASPPSTVATQQAPPQASSPQILLPAQAPVAAEAPPAAAPTLNMPTINSASPQINAPASDGVKTIFAQPAPVVQAIPETNQDSAAASMKSAEEPAQSSQTIVPAKKAPASADANMPVTSSTASAAKKQAEIVKPTGAASDMTIISDNTAPDNTANASGADAEATFLEYAPVNPVATDIAPDAEPIETAVTRADRDVANWALGLGSIVLIGGAAIMGLRRRRPAKRTDKPVMAAPVVAAHRDDDQLLMEDVLILNAASVSDEYRPHENRDEKALHNPAFAHWQDETMSETAPENIDVAMRREAMIAAMPSAANPFLTRKNRLRRANFLLANGGEYQGSVIMPQPVAAQAAQAPARQTKPAEQVTYRFSGAKNARVAFKPRYN